jgi:uncharacterized phage protein (TIGR01671 family)
MREILFRGKRCDNLEWVEGYLLKEGNYSTCSWNLGIEYKTDKFGKFAYDVAEIIPYTAGQFTGLTDKNSKKIFEGDIVRYMNKETMVVSYRNESASFVGTYSAINFNYCASLMSSSLYLEVIGNIHDNPELLED